MRPSVRRLLAVFLLGVIAGAALTAAAVAAQVERAVLQRDLFIKAAREQRQQLDQMRSQLEKFQTRPSIESVEIHLVNLGEERSSTALALQEKLRPLGAPLIGKMLDEVDPDMLKNIFQDRRVVHNESQYELAVQTIIIGPTTHFYLIIRNNSEAGFLSGLPGSRPHRTSSTTFADRTSRI